MCYRDLLEELSRRGLSVTESQVRWALRTGKLPRPKRDGSQRFVYTEHDVERITRLFSDNKTSARAAAGFGRGSTIR